VARVSRVTISQHRKTKWVTFTYSGKETRKITNLFKETQIKIANRTKNTIINTVKHHRRTGKCNKKWYLQNEMHKLPTKYIRQTDITFHTRYKEHIQVIRNSNSNYEYSTHILNTGRTYRTITDTMDIIRIQKIGKHIKNNTSIQSVKITYT
jgi:hypothetical protein